jgi:nitrous oxide reductase accessory protein NosL
MIKILLFFAIGLIACQEKLQNLDQPKKEISVTSISGDMGCENCGMNLKKFISTSHAFEMEDGESHFFCSINCSTIALEEATPKVKTVYGIDYGLTKYFPVQNLHYVIGSSLNGIMTKISKIAFNDPEKAENFKSTFSGENIISYEEAYNMSLEEIKSRKKKH